MNHYLALDCETGGISVDTSLLTAYLAVLNEKFELTDELELYVKPEDGKYIVTGQALEINRIDLSLHDKTAITYKAAKPILYEFLTRNNHGVKLTPIGHGVAFDIQRIKKDLISEGSWETFVSYRTLDTSAAVQFLRAAGKFPDSVSGSLGSLVSHFKLPSKGQLHNAKNDTLQTVSCLLQLINLVKNEKLVAQ